MNDTRKDKRAPVSLKVRFKSATVDEFVEHYSNDISHGGLFIKSKQPMAIGTLLKFELQLKDESKLIQGVGRVVWKREATDTTTDANPAGMGIKFIKMDPESRTLVDKIVEQRGDEPGQYEAGGGDKEGKEDDGLVASPSPAPRPVRSAKATMQFFPSAGPTEAELPPPEDRTQVRQASEFLAAALSEGGADDLAGKEAEAKAVEARKRTDEIEKEREAAAQKAKDEAEAKERAEKDARDRAEREKGEREDREKADAEAKKREAEEAALAEKAAKEKAAADAAKKAAAEKEAAAKKAAAAAEAKATPPKPADKPAVATPVAPPAEPNSNLLPIILGTILVIGVGGYFVYNAMQSPAETSTPPETTTSTEVTPPEGTEGTPPEGTEGTEGIEGTEGTEGTPPEGTEGTEGTPEGAEGTEGAVAVEADLPRVTFRVETTPPGATIRQGDATLGVSPVEVELMAGHASLVAHLDGYRDATQEIEVAEGQRPVRMTLEALPYRIEIVTTPPGATVRAGGRSGTSPATLTITRPTRDLRVSASLAGYTAGSANVATTAFAAGSDAMTARVEITLVAAPAATGGGGGGGRVRPPPTTTEGGGSAGSGGGGSEGSGGGGGSETSGGGSEGSGGGGGSEGSGGGGGGGSEGSGGSTPEEAPPENPF